MLIHTRTVAHKVFEVWRSPDRFTKNPDVIRLRSGRLLLVYSDTDSHWSHVSQVITILASDDDGSTWTKLSEVHTAKIDQGEERLVTPRLSRISDGRLVVICDHDDFRHFHEDQSLGNWIWWSRDEGLTWEGPCTNEIMGFEPDRIMELRNGRLIVGSHLVRRDAQEYAEVIHVSDDGGAHWRELATVAHDGYHRFCEGGIVLLQNESLMACVLRETRSAGLPSFLVFSEDSGETWSDPQMAPFALHRPYAKELEDGRVMVTGRHVNGGLGTYAWVGDLQAEAGTYAIGGPRRKYCAQVADGVLIIENRPEHECRYTMLPPQNCSSEVCFEAQLRVEGPPGSAVAFLSVASIRTKATGPVVVVVAPDAISLLGRDGPDTTYRCDMTSFRRLTLRHVKGLFTISIDGKEVIYGCVYRGEVDLRDARGGDPAKRNQFGQYGDRGKSYWRSVSFSSKNPTLDDYDWTWEGRDGSFPDAYQRRRMIQIHANHPDTMPDHGYSSWLTLPDGRIILVDYTNYGDPYGKSHLVGVHLEPEDIA